MNNSQPKPIELPVNVKAIISGTTVVMLENGDAIIIQVVPTNIKFVVGQKDAQGNPVYNFEVQQQIGVVGKNAKAPRQGMTDGAITTAEGDGRHGEQPG